MKLIEKTGICEELIIQDEEFGKMHPYSVNTIRIPQIINSSGDVEIFYPVMRVGQAKNEVDNAGQGGIFASINPNTGVVSSDGYNHNGDYFVSHPTTKLRFKGYIVPKWEEAVSMVKEMAKINPEVRYVAWDLAYTGKEWIVVEGNFAGELKMLQIAARRGLKKEFIELI